jgi:tetratricopeptide (TPR) repeat protein
MPFDNDPGPPPPVRTLLYLTIRSRPNNSSAGIFLDAMASDSVPQALHRARRLYAARQLDEAASLLRAILANNPDHLDALSFLGVIALQRGNPLEAVHLTERAINLAPAMAELHVNLAPVLQALGRLDDAATSCRKAIELKPGLIGAYVNLAQTLQAQCRFVETEECCREALSIDPNHAMIHNCLALALQSQDRLVEAQSEARRAIAIAPALSQAWNTLGMVLMDAGQIDESIAALERSLALNPSSPPTHYNYAMALLLSGNLRRGFAEYEWRWKCPSTEPLHRNYPWPRWDGSDLIGKTLLVHAEQGFGDVIQLIRYVPQIATRCGRVVVSCRPEMRCLLSAVEGIAQIIGFDDSIECVDSHLPLMSLPLILGTTLENIPANVPYLQADQAAVAQWQTRTSGALGKLKVGIAWAGNPSHANDRRRSLPSTLLSSLSEVDGIAWYSLQKSTGDPRPARPPLPLMDLTSSLSDFSETAAFMQTLDLIITVDTAVAHLAGALGKPVWILLPFAPDWRWMRDREDSPWYPTARLLRQPGPGDWNSVIGRVRDELRRVAMGAL